MTYEHGRCSSPATTSTTKATTQSTPPPSPPPPPPPKPFLSSMRAQLHSATTTANANVTPTSNPIVPASTPGTAATPPRLTLYPRIEPYLFKYLRVSGGHTVYYEVSGNSAGLPVCFVHGGPGGGTEPAHRRFFDPAVYKIVLIDQRGCGRSTPHASLAENTTWDLVDDMDAVRVDAAIDRWVLFGGSWGSTLALTYAQQFPHRVLGMILRGIFLARQQELRWLYERDGIALLFPEAFEKYLNGLPPELRDEPSLMCAYHSILSRDERSEERRIAANAWSQWEYTLSTFPRGGNDIIKPHNIFRYPQQHPAEDGAGAGETTRPQQNMITGGVDYDDDSVYDHCDDINLAFARIESHYFVNGCFYEDDGLLLSDERMRRVEHIKTCIVQGRWDFVCPRKTAFDLAKKFKPENVQTYIIDNAGHSTFEPGIEQALLQAVIQFGNEFSSEKYFRNDSDNDNNNTINNKMGAQHNHSR